MSASVPVPVIPGYRIERQLGQGGMATVYLATQEALGRQVAVKVMMAERAPSEDLVRRFEQETRVIAQLDHPHIVSIYEVGRTASGLLYFTMPCLGHGDLSSRDLREDQRAIVTIARALCQALAYAHASGIVHRDVKPENVLFDKLDRPLLADFGIALTSNADVRVTREGATLGSSGYMSPEQARGLPLDGRSDLYSLGVMCFEKVTGHLPFDGSDSLAVALAHVENAVPRLPPTRRHWQALVDKAMAKNPDERFQNAWEFLSALDMVQAHLEGRNTLLESVLPSTAKAPSQRDWLVAVGAAAAVVIGILAFWPRTPNPERAPATETEVVTAPLVTTPPASTVAAPVPAAPPAPSAEKPIAQLLREGNELARRGKLVEPAGDNAAERYLAALTRDSESKEAKASLGRVLGSLETRMEKSLQNADYAAARGTVDQARLLADQVPAPARDDALWKTFAKTALSDLKPRVANAAQTFDRKALEGLAAPIGALGAEGGEVLREVQGLLVLQIPGAGTPLRDSGAPALVFVPARGSDGRVIDHAFALGTNEITRADYDAFARATGRAPAGCRVPHQPLSRLRKIDWRNPGFAQTNADPAVCVSWLDARAYTRWLSQRTGATYRLPTQAEWLHAAPGLGASDACGTGNVADSSKNALFGGDRYACGDGFTYTAPVGHFKANAFGVHDLLGNVSEWTLDCKNGVPAEALLKDNGCPERVFRGTSWRDGPKDAPATYQGASDPDVAYTTVGFRVLREVALDTLPKQALAQTK